MFTIYSAISHAFDVANRYLKNNESAAVYATASIAPIFVINWGHVIEAIVVSCVAGTIPLLVKHIYRTYVSPETDSKASKGRNTKKGTDE